MSHASTSIAVIALAMLAPAFASAEPSQPKGVNMRALGEHHAAPVAKPGSRTGGMKPCPEYGAGFYRLEGSNTCARIGGGIAVDAGTSGNRR